MKVTRPEDFHRSYADAFNSGDIEVVLDHYERDATFVPQPGQTVSGRAAIGEALQHYQAVGKMTVETRYCVTSRGCSACRRFLEDQRLPGRKAGRGPRNQRGSPSPSTRGTLAARRGPPMGYIAHAP